MAPFPSLTKVWHNEPYDAIDPTRPELAVWKCKVVVVTGGGGSIGGAIALAFARAGSTRVAVIGRREDPLTATKKSVEDEAPGTEVLVVTGDLASAKSISDAIQTIVKRFGKIDLLVANAGYLSRFAPIAESEADEWWKGFEVNCKGAFNLTRAFLPHAADGAIVLNISTGLAHMPAMAGASSHVASKLAATKIWEAVGVENPNIEVVHIQPGVVESESSVKAGKAHGLDSAHLPGHFAVWLVSPEAKKFRSKYLWANWDVPELLSRQEELSQPDQLTITLNGWPFG